MNAEIKTIATSDGAELTDIEVDGNFHLGIRIAVGFPGHDGADLFDLWVCSTSWLEQQSLPYSGQYLVVMNKFDATQLEGFLRGKIMSLSGKTSSEVLMKVARFAYWEYADMSSSPTRNDDSR
jgi:immunity protein 8 of polymorphic toxin system